MSGRAYYNERDPYCVEWLRNLIAAGHIADGDVDERSIEYVCPADLRGYTQCHFFAGIGVWSYALRLAGWDDSRPVWTGSCPCQPFSAAGKGLGFADERHLWPAWFHLISQCRPVDVFGEQVASSDGLGWLDLVQTDLEGAAYTSAAIDLCAAGIGAPHARQRLYFVAHTDSERFSRRSQPHERPQQSEQQAPRWRDAGGCSAHGSLAFPGGQRRKRGQASASGHINDWTASERPQGEHGPSIAGSYWSRCDWIPCRDGKFRPVEPGTFPLAHGAPARVGRLRAYGNAINAEAAAAFIRAYLDVGRGGVVT